MLTSLDPLDGYVCVYMDKNVHKIASASTVDAIGKSNLGWRLAPVHMSVTIVRHANYRKVIETEHRHYGSNESQSFYQTCI